MPNAYLGHQSPADPLYPYLRDHILPQVSVWQPQADFRVHQFSASRDVYLYEERHTGARVVGKFHPPHKTPELRLHSTGEAEFSHLTHLRSLGLDCYPHYVVKPLGFNSAINNVLFTEFLQGDSLSSVINQAMHQGRRDRLFRKLSSLAHFLATMHNRTAGELPVDFNHGYGYMGQLINSLVTKRGMGPGRSEHLYRLREAWRARSFMWEDRSVLVHGDVTPSNFLFERGRQVLAIDLERMRWADRVFDLGRLCGELCHFFFQGLGDPGAAEPFIGHFLWEYACHFPDRHSAFASVTRRIPFYMGITLLRIARNSWIGQDYRWRLVARASSILGAHT